MMVSLTWSLCSCLHPTVFFFLVFHFGRPGTHLIFYLQADTPSMKNRHTQTHALSGQSFQGSALLSLRVSGLVSHLHVTSGLPEAQTGDISEKV